MSRLEVTVVEGENLKQTDKFKKNNCFIRMYLNNQKRKTTTINNSNDPQWKEVFIFDNVKEQDILYIIIYAEDKIKNKTIGSLQFNLLNLQKKGHIDTWFHIPAETGLACNGRIHLVLDLSNNDLIKKQ